VSLYILYSTGGWNLFFTWWKREGKKGVATELVDILHK